MRDEKYLHRFKDAMQFFYKKHFGGSFFFEFLMKIGAFIFALLKQKQQKQRVVSVDEYILFSKDEKLRNQLQYQLQKNVHRFVDINENELFSQAHVSGKHLEILLDNNSFSFKEIIAFLEKQKNKNYTFKIIPEKTSFMIGSNSSYDRGEVINIE